jgi:hypothetical protein
VDGRLVELSLRLLFNLSFDATLREQMVRGDDYGFVVTVFTVFWMNHRPLSFDAI